ncbi:MAG TPA: hydantoinase B/oxoprolinase family protein, partial [Acetobacteraceae bacterium]|nr:hydantoinase B/oxoprolinase family protein [Acetobacteraceae bacterium]
EQVSPLLVEEWCLVPDSGGAGRFRGGLTSCRTYRVNYDEATFTVSGERGRSAPAGQFGGRAGSLFLCRVQEAGGGERMVAAKGGVTVVKRGDRVSIQPAGSGGYGDPRERKRAAIEADLADGYVTAEAVLRDYGLISKPREAAMAEQPR